MWRLIESEIPAVINGGQTLVGAFRIMDTVIATPTRHERRNHYLRSHRERLAHKVFFELSAHFDEDATNFMAECERPRKLFGPVTFEDMQVGAAYSAGTDFDERRLLGNSRPRNGADHRLRAGASKRGNADRFHFSPNILGLCLFIKPDRRHE